MVCVNTHMDKRPAKPMTDLSINEAKWAQVFATEPRSPRNAFDAFRVDPVRDVMTAQMGGASHSYVTPCDQECLIATQDRISMTLRNALVVIAALGWYHRIAGSGAGSPRSPNGWRWVKVGRDREERHPTMSLTSLTDLLDLKSERSIEILMQPCVDAGILVPGRSVEGGVSYRVLSSIIGANQKSFASPKRMIVARRIGNAQPCYDTPGLFAEVPAQQAHGSL